MRFIHLLVIGILIFGAAYVYRIKMASTTRIEAVAHLHAEIRAERDGIAALRAEWARLDSPARLQRLTERHITHLKPANVTQYDQVSNLPMRPPRLVAPDEPDPIGAMIGVIEKDSNPDGVTGSLSTPESP